MASKMTFALSPSLHKQDDFPFPYLGQTSSTSQHADGARLRGLPAVKLWRVGLRVGAVFFPAYTRMVKPTSAQHKFRGVYKANIALPT